MEKKNILVSLQQISIKKIFSFLLPVVILVAILIGLYKYHKHTSEIISDLNKRNAELVTEVKELRPYVKLSEDQELYISELEESIGVLEENLSTLESNISVLEKNLNTLSDVKEKTRR